MALDRSFGLQHSIASAGSAFDDPECRRLALAVANRYALFHNHVCLSDTHVRSSFIDRILKKLGGKMQHF